MNRSAFIWELLFDYTELQLRNKKKIECKNLFIRVWTNIFCSIFVEIQY